MRGIHPKSFGLGVASGVVVLLLVLGGMHLLQPRRAGFGGPMGGGTFQQGGAPNLARMAQRLGITEDELSKELAAGKTMPQIATEHGVDMSGGFGRGGPRGGTGTTMNEPPRTGSGMKTGSGDAMSVSSSTTVSSSSSSQAR